jgi:histidinol phosphatase-like enzyme
MKKKLVIAVDFDGTLCKTDFPKIIKQTKIQKKLLENLKMLKKKGHKLILWTCRGDNKKYPALTDAVNWCKKQGLIFNSVNKNIKGQKKISGYSPKVIADIYIDDKCINYKNWKNI